MGIIEKEKFDNFSKVEKEKFLIDARVYVRRANLKFPDCTLPDENGYIYIKDFFASHIVNKIVIKEMTTYFEEIEHVYFTDFIEFKYDFEERMGRALDNSDKERIIRNDHVIYSDKLNKDTSTIDYFSINSKEGNMFDCIHAFRNEEEVIEYITQKDPFLSDLFSFETCGLIREWDKILKFLKGELYKIKGSNEERVCKPKPTTPLPFNDKIFRTMEAQNWFYDTLNKMGAIEDHNKPIRRKFQPICSAIFYSISCKKHILKYGLKLQDLINFLNKEFKTKIKTKLSVGHLHEDEVSKNIEKFIENNNLA